MQGQTDALQRLQSARTLTVRSCLQLTSRCLGPSLSDQPSSSAKSSGSSSRKKQSIALLGEFLPMARRLAKVMRTRAWRDVDWLSFGCLGITSTSILDSMPQVQQDCIQACRALVKGAGGGQPAGASSSRDKGASASSQEVELHDRVTCAT